MSVPALFALLTMLAHSSLGAQNIDWQWRTGRASYFGVGNWPIHIGGCNYGYLWSDESTGWDVAALADVNGEYVDSCGTCYEVRCDNRWTSDNYGDRFDRTGACRDPQASVVVRIVDTCQCTYAPNPFSNKRWCCGDVDHFDMSLWAFEKLAELRWGVIPLLYRPVPCDYKPDRPALPLSSPSPGIPPVPPKDAVRTVRDWPGIRNTSIVARTIFEDKLDSGFYDVSWGTWVQPLYQSATSGMLGGQGLCARISNGGALALQAWRGVFQGAVMLEFWTYVGKVAFDGSAAQVPDITINIGGDQGDCRPVRVMQLKPVMFQPRCVPYCDDYWWAYKVYLPAFAGADSSVVINTPRDFGGCGGNTADGLTHIQFRHDGYGGSGDKWVCFDHIMLG